MAVDQSLVRAPHGPLPTRGSHVSAGILALGTVAAVVVVGTGAALGPMPGLGALAAVAAGLAVLFRPALGAYALVALAPALSGLQRGLPVPGFRVSELLIVGVATIILVTARRTPRWGVLDVAAFAYVVATAFFVWFNLVRHGDPITADNLGTLFGPLQFFLLYRAILTALPEPHERATAIRLLLFASVPVSLLTLLQQFDVVGARALIQTLTGTDIYLTTADEVARATGPFPHWHNLGGFLFMILLLCFSLLLERTQTVIRRGTLVVVMIPAVAALAQTVSFSPLFGVAAGTLIIGLTMGQSKRVLVWLGVGALTTVLVFAPLFEQRVEQQYRNTSITEDQSLVPQTIAFRIKVWTEQFVPLIQDNLVVGYGPNLPPNLFFQYAESLYVTFLLRGGIPLLLIYLGLMAALAARARHVSRSEQVERRIVGRVVFASVLLLLLIDTIATYFLDSGPAPLLWALAGLMGYEPIKTALSRGESGNPGRPPSG